MGVNSKCGVQSKRVHYYYHGGLLLLLNCPVAELLLSLLLRIAGQDNFNRALFCSLLTVCWEFIST